jgi:hypothetical protein
MFSTPALDAVRILRLTGGDGHARIRSRVRALPETIGEIPSAVLAEEIETAGPGQAPHLRRQPRARSRTDAASTRRSTASTRMVSIDST